MLLRETVPWLTAFPVFPATLMIIDCTLVKGLARTHKLLIMMAYGLTAEVIELYLICWLCQRQQMMLIVMFLVLLSRQNSSCGRSIFVEIL